MDLYFVFFILQYIKYKNQYEDTISLMEAKYNEKIMYSVHLCIVIFMIIPLRNSSTSTRCLQYHAQHLSSVYRMSHLYSSGRTR